MEEPALDDRSGVALQEVAHLLARGCLRLLLGGALDKAQKRPEFPKNEPQVDLDVSPHLRDEWGAVNAGRTP